MIKETILEVKNLSTYFKTDRGYMKAVDGMSFSVKKKEVLGVVGESGCGKSVTMQSIMRLFDESKARIKYKGDVVLDGESLMTIPLEKFHDIRGKRISMVFQDALSALDPLYTIGEQIEESLKIHTTLDKKARRNREIELLTLVGINSPEKRINQYPHEFSGGMRQRIMIAIALSCQPEILIADEPTTALDVTIQAQILDLMLDLKEKCNMSIILITHDLSVVAQVCERVIVMYLGQVVEMADIFSIFDNPLHPYTRGLLKSIPQVDGKRVDKLFVIKGVVPLLSQIPMGCHFAPRCSCATNQCLKAMPQLEQVNEGHYVRCWNYQN